MTTILPVDKAADVAVVIGLHLARAKLVSASRVERKAGRMDRLDDLVHTITERLDS